MRWVVGLVWIVASAVSAQAADLVPISKDLGAWRLEVRDPAAAATIQMESGALRFDITRKPTEPRLVQVFQAGKFVRDGAVYTLRFAAKASANRPILINMQTDSSPWRQLIDTWPTVNLTTQWQTYSVELRVKEARGATVRIPQFILGQATGTVWIKDVVVTNAASATIPPDGPATAGPANPAPTDPANTKPAGNSEGGVLGPMADWKIETHQGAEAAIEMADGMVRATVAKKGPERWNVQLFQTPANLTAGQPYMLTLGIRSDAPRKITFVVQHDEEPYDTLLPFTDLEIGPEWKQYKLKFTLSKIYPAHTRLAIQLGDAPGTVDLRTVTLIEAAAK